MKVAMDRSKYLHEKETPKSVPGIHQIWKHLPPRLGPTRGECSGVVCRVPQGHLFWNSVSHGRQVILTSAAHLLIYRKDLRSVSMVQLEPFPKSLAVLFI